METDNSGILTAKCESCGSEILFYNEKQCPFCGSYNIVSEEKSEKITADGVIHFKSDKSRIQQIFHNHIKNHFFAPSLLKNLDFTGIYIPFKLYDATALSTYFGKGGRERTVKNKDGHQLTSTDWRSLTGFIEEPYYDVPVCENEVYEDIEKILPYDLKNVIPYSDRRISGYPVLKSVSDEDSLFSKACKKMEKSLKSLSKKDINSRGFHYSSIEKIETHYTEVKSRKVLFPVWAASINYRGKMFSYMINDENGKIIGKIPVSIAKIIILCDVLVLAVLCASFFNN